LHLLRRHADKDKAKEVKQSVLVDTILNWAVHIKCVLCASACAGMAQAVRLCSCRVLARAHRSPQRCGVVLSQTCLFDTLGSQKQHLAHVVLISDNPFIVDKLQNHGQVRSSASRATREDERVPRARTSAARARARDQHRRH
jgi:hypothetical protein